MADRPLRVFILGGGPAGVMAALTCAEVNPEVSITLLEKESTLLGAFQRPNRFPWCLSRDLPEPAAMAAQCLRGAREMLGPFHHWGSTETTAWFESLDLPLVLGDQGAFQPPEHGGITAISKTLISLLHERGITIMTGAPVRNADAKSTGGFWLTLDNEETLECDRLIMAGGGLLANRCQAISSAFGHTVVRPIPSIFDLHTRDERILKAHGVCMEHTRLADDSGAVASGCVTLEPWGLGGPAIGELTARAAESMCDRSYAFRLRVDWIGALPNVSQNDLSHIARLHPKRAVGEESHAPVPHRFWLRLLKHAGISPETPWQRLSKSQSRALHRQLRHDQIKITKRGAHQQETSVCGGIALNEVDFRTMASRLIPNLFFAGAMLDADALPGGANLQITWTTGRLAGLGAASR